MEKQCIVFVESVNFGWMVSEETLDQIQSEARQTGDRWLSNSAAVRRRTRRHLLETLLEADGDIG